VADPDPTSPPVDPLWGEVEPPLLGVDSPSLPDDPPWPLLDVTSLPVLTAPLTPPLFALTPVSVPPPPLVPSVENVALSPLPEDPELPPPEPPPCSLEPPPLPVLESPPLAVLESPPLVVLEWPPLLVPEPPPCSPDFELSELPELPSPD
jgi:hypothetical protein